MSATIRPEVPVLPARGHARADALDVLFEASPECLLGVSTDGVIVRRNQRAELLFGCGLVGEPLSSHLRGESALLESHVDGRELIEACRGRRHDGSTFSAEVSHSAVATSEGEGEGELMVLGIRDVGARRQTDIAAARLAAVVRSSQDAIVGKTLDGLITSWNPAAERLFGFTPEEVLGTHVRRLVPSRLWREEEELLRTSAKGVPVDGYETVRLHRDGHPVDVLVSISPVLDDAGAIMGLASVLHDNTAQKLRMEHTRDLNAAILNILEDFSDEKARLGDTQRAVLNILEDFSDEKARLNDTQRAVLNILDDIADEREKVVGFNLSLREEIAQRTAVEATLRDKTDELVTSNAELEQFAYVASHDLQEPLRKVASFCQLLAQQYQGRLDDKADIYLGFVVDGAMRMQQLIDDLLAFARLGRSVRGTDPVDCACVLAAAVDNLGKVIAETGAEIVALTELPVVTGDESRVQQVFQNLIGNSLKFRGPSSPRMEVSARREGDEWVISFADNGIGIEPQYADRIFVVFQRLHTREEYPGTGIGLAICKKIVEQMDGRIWFDSEPGAGTTFHLAVPVRGDASHD